MINFSEETIREQTARILSSDRFKSSKNLTRFLQYIIDKMLEEKHDQIKAYSIGVDVFGRPDSYDARSDSFVRVYGGRLRKELMNYYLNEGKNDPIIISVPTGKYIPVFKESQKPDPDQNPSIGIIVFDKINTGDDHFFLTTGLTEQLIVHLSKFTEINIIGPISRDKISGSIDSYKEIGKIYQTDFILYGSVSSTETRIKAVMNLIEADTGKTIWAKSYVNDLTIEKIFEIQDEISASIASSISGMVGVIAREKYASSKHKRPENLSVFEAIMKCYHWRMNYTKDAFNEMLKALLQANAKAPPSAKVKALLADIYVHDHQFGLGMFENSWEKATDLAKQALELDPEELEVQIVNSAICTMTGEKELCFKYMDRALQQNPNNTYVLGIYSLFKLTYGELEEGYKMMERAMTLNPQYPGWYPIVPCLYYYFKGENQLALDHAFLMSSPVLIWEPLLRASLLGQQGRSDEAKHYIEKLLQMQPDFNQSWRRLMQNVLISDENVNLVSDGLKKAGMPII